LSNCFSQHFLEWVQKDPIRPAVADLACTWTYEDLYEKATQIAATLETFSDSEVRQVAILGNKSNVSIAAILGTLFADFAYCPLDLSLPSLRLEKIFSMLSPLGLILTGLTPPVVHALKGMKKKSSFILDLGEDLPPDIFEGVKRITLKRKDYILIKKKPKNHAYTIFTSGSTGVPKGVCLSHRAVDAALCMFQEHINIKETDRICNLVPLCFDLSVFDILGSLRQGATIYLTPPVLGAVPNRLVQYIKDKSISSLFTVPSTINYLFENTDKNLKNSDLKNLLLSGEPLSEVFVEKIESYFPQSINLWNLYGATEIPYALAARITKKSLINHFSLKRKGVEVRIDASGELMIKSPAVFLGYHLEGSTELHSPLKEEWYPTGDRASIDSNGSVTIQGRKDRQVKLQGHRVELDEIECELESYQEIQEAAVIVDENSKTLVAFVVIKSGFHHKEIAKIFEERCRSALPLVMCPHCYVFLSQMPRTLSGKKDRNSLLKEVPQPVLKKEYL